AVLTAPAADGARLVLELSAAPDKPSIFALTGPDRLVIDLPRTSAAGGLKLPKPVGPVRQIRDGVQPNGKLRLVLELTQGFTWKSRVEGRQLILELGQAPVAQAAVAATPSAPQA